MTEFEIGDSVKIIANVTGGHHIPIGTNGKIGDIEQAPDKVWGFL